MATTTEPTDVRSEDFARLMETYPFPQDVDGIDELPRVVFTADDNGSTFTARVLGFGSSYRESHVNHQPGTPLERGVRCSGCRWTDTAILKSDTGHYVFVSLGKSAIEGEWQRSAVIWTEDPKEVLRKMFVPTKKEFVRDTGPMSIPPHNADAFRQAAHADDALGALLEEYETVIPEVDARTAGSDPLADL